MLMFLLHCSCDKFWVTKVRYRTVGVDLQAPHWAAGPDLHKEDRKIVNANVLSTEELLDCKTEDRLEALRGTSTLARSLKGTAESKETMYTSARNSGERTENQTRSGWISEDQDTVVRRTRRRKGSAGRGGEERGQRRIMAD